MAFRVRGQSTTDWGRQILIACACASRVLASESALASPNTPEGTAALEIRLDERRYAEYQPILAIVCLRNTAQTTLTDVAPLRLESGFLRLEIRRVGSESDMPRRAGMIWNTVFPQGGLEVPAGGTTCEAINILRHFGRPSEAAPEPARLAHLGTIPQGAYRLRGVLDVHTDYTLRRGGKQERVYSDWVDFVVTSASAESQAAIESLDRYLRRGDSGQAKIRQGPHIAMRVGPHVREFVHGPMAILAYQLSRTADRPLPDEELLAALGRGGRSNVARAWVLFDQIRISSARDGARRGWAARRLAGEASDIDRDVLNSWLLHFDQRKGYMSNGE